MAVLSPSTDCRVEERASDWTSTPELDAEPITRALDLLCTEAGVTPEEASMAVTNDGAVVTSGALRMLVREAGASVEDIGSLDPGVILAGADDQETGWLFGMTYGNSDLYDVRAVRETAGGWMGATIASVVSRTVLNGVAMDNDSAGYLTYVDYQGDPHLATWDGSCWTDESLVVVPPEPILSEMGAAATVRLDGSRRPWLAWLVRDYGAASLHLRRAAAPSSLTLPVDLSLVEPLDPPCLQLLPGGASGNDSPIVGVRSRNGIFLFTPDDDSPPGEVEGGWLERVLPESARGDPAGDCPELGRQYRSDPCLGLTRCTEQLRDTSHGFGLARTASGRTFVAWVAYAAESSYALEEWVDSGGEMLLSDCFRSEPSGSGTAELIVARLTETEPVLTRFRFAIEGALGTADRPLVMEARDETLLVAAVLSGGATRRLTYLEIDSRSLP